MSLSATHHTRLGAPHVLILLEDDEPAMSSCRRKCRGTLFIQPRRRGVLRTHPARILALSKFAKTLKGLLIERDRTSMLPCDPEKMNSGLEGDTWTKK
jgi:hypothetical protein